MAITLGPVLFGERIHTAPASPAGTACGLALFLVGIVLLDTSPLVHALHRQQTADARRS